MVEIEQLNFENGQQKERSTSGAPEAKLSGRPIELTQARYG
jgi:hypothetical protein